MYRFVLATLCAIIVTASAAPVLRHGESNGRHNLGNSYYPARDSFCMTDTDAQEVASTYAQVITNYTEALVNETFAMDFQDWSSSTNYLVSESCNAPMPVGPASQNASRLNICSRYADRSLLRPSTLVPTSKLAKVLSQAFRSR